MSTLFVQTGQCGNQLGYQLLSDLFTQVTREEANLKVGDNWQVEQELDLWFRESETTPGKYYARCVCLDTEPKVINDITEKARAAGSHANKTNFSSSSRNPQVALAKKHNAELSPLVSGDRRWIFDKASIAYQHGGAGNNWAVGYQMCSGEYLEMAIDCIRREFDKSTKPLSSVVVVHGVAGGTGSGLGTRITEEIADQFGDSLSAIINIAITPYHFGEVVVQHYNALLCLSKISSASSGVLLFENEVAQELCRHMRGMERPTLSHINKVISSNIMPILLPKKDGKIGRCSYLADDIEHLCPHPGYKLLDVKMTPQTSENAVSFTYDSWHTLISTITKMQIKGTPSERGLGRMKLFDVSQQSSGPDGTASSVSDEFGCKNLASILTLYGSDATSVATNMHYCSEDFPIATESCVTNSSGRSPHGPYQRALSDLAATTDPIRTFFLAPYSNKVYNSVFESVRTCVSTHCSVNGYQRSATLLSNGSTVLPLVNRVRTKAAQLFDHQAFTHCYARNGVDEDDFISAFRNVGQIISNYNML